MFAGLITAAVIGVGVWLGAGRGVSAGSLLAFLFLVNLLVEPVQMMVETLDLAQSAGAGVRRILGVLDTPVDVPDPVDGVDLPAGRLDVDFEGVRFRYPTGPDVICDLTVRIPNGTRVAVVGETGSGKTTFAKLVTRLLDPTEGWVLIGGVPLNRVRFASLRRRVAFVPQEGFLFDTTVGGNVRYGKPEAGDDEVAAAFAELGLSDWLEQLPAGLDTPVGERGSRLSAGERQLVALVRAWIADPDLLVLDEATSAVDPALEVRLRRAIERLTGGTHQHHRGPPALDRRGRRRGAGLRARPPGGAGPPRRPAGRRAGPTPPCTPTGRRGPRTSESGAGSAGGGADFEPGRDHLAQFVGQAAGGRRRFDQGVGGEEAEDGDGGGAGCQAVVGAGQPGGGGGRVEHDRAGPGSPARRRRGRRARWPPGPCGAAGPADLARPSSLRITRASGTVDAGEVERLGGEHQGGEAVPAAHGDGVVVGLGGVEAGADRGLGGEAHARAHPAAGGAGDEQGVAAVERRAAWVTGIGASPTRRAARAGPRPGRRRRTRAARGAAG